MTATLIGENWSDRTASVDERYVRRYTRSFRVTTDSALDGPGEVGSASGLPTIGTVYLEPGGYVDLTARCTGLRPTPDSDNPQAWTVVAEYSSAPPGTGTNPDPRQAQADPAEWNVPNPELRPPTIRWGTATYTRAIEQARRIDPDTEDLTEEEPVTNSAGFPFDPPPEKEEQILTLTYTRNESTFDPNVILTYVNAVNEDTFLGAPKWHVRCTGIQANRRYEQGQYFYEVTYDFEFHPESWWTLILDAGHQDINDAIKKDGDGTPYPDPWPLDGEGEFLAAPTTDNKVWLVYLFYRPVAFAPLAITL